LNFVKISCNDSGEILSGISALCPGGQTFISKKHLKGFANAYSISEKDLKEKPLEKNLLRRASQLPTSLEQFHSSVVPSQAAFDCSCKFLLIDVSLLPSPALHAREVFQKMKLVKTFLRNSVTSEGLSYIHLLSIEKVQDEK